MEVFPLHFEASINTLAGPIRLATFEAFVKTPVAYGELVAFDRKAPLDQYFAAVARFSIASGVLFEDSKRFVETVFDQTAHEYVFNHGMPLLMERMGDEPRAFLRMIEILGKHHRMVGSATALRPFRAPR